MDEGEIIEEVQLIPRLHDRWSLLVLGLDYVADIAMVTTNMLTTATKMAAQHAVQSNTDHEFPELMGE